VPAGSALNTGGSPTLVATGLTNVNAGLLTATNYFGFRDASAYYFRAIAGTAAFQTEDGIVFQQAHRPIGIQ